MAGSAKAAIKATAKAFNFGAQHLFFPPLTRLLRSHTFNSASTFHSLPSTSAFSALNARHSTSLAARTTSLAAALLSSTLSADDLPLTGSCGIAKVTAFETPSHVHPTPEPAGLLGQAGEDAFFIAANGCAWGIADGVGGWASHPGANSALYSRTLMSYALKKATEIGVGKPSLPSTPTPLAILESAYEETRLHNIIGSTTACVVTWDPQQQRVSYANLGDSGLLLIRAPPSSAPSPPSRPPYERSVERQHSFNCPYQLGHSSRDRPRDAAVAEFDVSDGDLLVLYSDGLVDNLSPTEIIRIVDEFASHPPAQPLPSSPLPASSPPSLDALARLLCDRAHAAARDPKRDTPFSRNCRQAGKWYQGGKMVSITHPTHECLSAALCPSTHHFALFCVLRTTSPWSWSSSVQRRARSRDERTTREVSCDLCRRYTGRIAFLYD